MKPTLTLAEATTPNGTHLALIEHDGHYYLQGDGMPLQSSYTPGGAEQLATLACAPLRSVRQPRLLLGGLGLGFTLASARAALPQKRATFLVAEAIAELPSWHRQFLEALHPAQLDDPRLLVRTQDLSEALRRDRDGFHAILLDAGGLPAQEGITDRKGLPVSSFLHQAHSALKEGGLLAVASSLDAATLERRFRQAGFDVACESVPTAPKGKQTRRSSSSIWLARKGAFQKRSPA